MNAFILLKLLRTPGALNEVFEDIILQDTVSMDELFIEDTVSSKTPLITEVDMILFEDGSSLYSETGSLLVTH